MMALSALKDHMPQFSRAAALNGAQHLSLLQGNCDSVRGISRAAFAFLQKPVAVLPQTVCDGWHRDGLSHGHDSAFGFRWIGTKAAEDLIDDSQSIDGLRVSQMQIDDCGLQAAVSQKLLNLPQ